MLRVIAVFLSLYSYCLHALPEGFIYLHDLAPDILEDLRYSKDNNFMGRPAKGYTKGRCILTLQAAKQLLAVQKSARQAGYVLKVYDCYRPQQAVNDFYQWSQNPNDTRMKKEFYPREAKATLFDRGYISQTSGHTRGSTVDLTLVKMDEVNKRESRGSISCYSRSNEYANDNSFNTGTRFDCLDPSAHVFYTDITNEQKNNRLLLRQLMITEGFTPYDKEWWHFTLKNEPYPETYFDFPVL